MKHFLIVSVLVSVPVLLMMQALQSYRYTIALEQMDSFEELQRERLEENKRVLAGIAVFSAPKRVYSVGTETLGLEPADPENVTQVRIEDDR